MTATPNKPIDVEELGRVIMAYSEITERLQESQEMLRARVEALQAEVAEKNREIERRQRLAALGEMAAGMAHEIRNPLGGMQLYLDALADEVAGSAAATELARRIGGGVKRLEAIVGQTLSFTSQMTADPRPVNLHAVLADAAGLAGGAAVICRPDLTATVDPELIGQAVLNLLRNAADAGGTGRVSAEVYGDRLHVAVADDGPGFPAEVLDRAFDPFFTTRAEGTGLGLAIVHRVAEAHGGDAVIENLSGGGAAVTLRLPVELAAAALRAAGHGLDRGQV